MAVGEKAESILKKLNPFWTNLKKLNFFETARTFFFCRVSKKLGAGSDSPGLKLAF